VRLELSIDNELCELGCASVADLFHALRALGQPLGSVIGRQSIQLKKQQQKLTEGLAKTTEQTKRAELTEALWQLEVQRAIRSGVTGHQVQDSWVGQPTTQTL